MHGPLHANWTRSNEHIAHSQITFCQYFQDALLQQCVYIRIDSAYIQDIVGAQLYHICQT